MQTIPEKGEGGRNMIKDYKTLIDSAYKGAGGDAKYAMSP